jgi:hypothetical protein
MATAVDNGEMKKALFDDLVTSLKQAGAIHRGRAKPSRRFVFDPEDVRGIRRTLNRRDMPRRVADRAKPYKRSR